MTLLILTTDDPSAGCLRASRIADHAIAIEYRLVTGPVPPVAEPVAFFSRRAELGGSKIARWDQDGPGSRLSRCWFELMDMCKRFEDIEIWPNPDPNSQLQLVQLLGWLRSCPDIVQKLTLASPDFRISQRKPEDIASLRPRPGKISDAQFDIANLALRAFQQPTPEACFRLTRERSLDDLPHLRRALGQLLEELPDRDTALTSSETELMNIISKGPIVPMRLMGEYIGNNPLSVLDYWELGEALHRLAHCHAPAILGLTEGSFTLELHDDQDRFEKYQRSKLSLSELGQALLEKQADFSRQNEIDRWWGGTSLTNDRLWRWDAKAHGLVSP
jgi:hypothetical protein